MSEVVIMPKLGYNMDEGQLIKWCKAVGDDVRKGDVLFEINTDKTTIEVESTCDGILLKTLINEGDVTPVFTPIAVIGAEREDPEAILAAFGGDKTEADEQAPEPAAPHVAAALDVSRTEERGELKLTPKARKLLRESGDIDPSSLAAITPTGFRGGITAKDVLAARDVKASPLARKIAARNGVDLEKVQGSGVGGKIMQADVELALPAAVSPAPAMRGMKVLRTTPYRGVRKIIGDRLSASMATAPHLYFTDSVDVAALHDLRARLASEEIKVSVSDLLILAASKALRAHPDVNVSLIDDQIVCYQSVNVGIAVAGDNGLIVPVVKETETKTISSIARETRDLVERAKVGKLSPEEYSGGTFTISNLGMFGIGNFTAIINPPEAAILAVSSVRKTPVMVTGKDGEEEIAVRPIMNITLSVDHRLIDGLLAATFLGCFKRLLEHPLSILS